MHKALHRLFIAIEVEPNEKIIRIHEEIKKTDVPKKMVELHNMHLTLKFLGDTPEEKIPIIENVLTEVSKNTNKFDLNFYGCGAFPSNKRINVVWLGVNNPEPCIQLAKYIDEKLGESGFEREKRGFTPHLTLARIKFPKNIEQLQKIIQTHQNTEFGVQSVNSIKLKKSILSDKGPTYYTMASCELK